MLLLDNKPLCTDNRFPDGTLALRINTGVAIDKCGSRCITWHYESDIEMSALYYVTKHLKNAGFSVVLFLPYIPNARMDRVKNSDEIFTLKYFAEFINSLGFDTVYTRDPHSNVSCALINNLQVDNGFEYIISAIDKIDDKELEIPIDSFIMKKAWEQFKIELPRDNKSNSYKEYSSSSTMPWSKLSKEEYEKLRDDLNTKIDKTKSPLTWENETWIAANAKND